MSSLITQRSTGDNGTALEWTVTEKGSRARVNGKPMNRPDSTTKALAIFNGRGHYQRTAANGLDQTFVGLYDPLSPFYFSPQIPERAPAKSDTWSFSLAPSGYLSKGGNLQARQLGEAMYKGKHAWKVSFAGPVPVESDESMISSTFGQAIWLQGTLRVQGTAYLDEASSILLGMTLHLNQEADQNFYKVPPDKTTETINGKSAEVVVYPQDIHKKGTKRIGSNHREQDVTTTIEWLP